MNFRPSDQQRLLVRVAREFLDTRCPLTLVQELARDRRGFRDDLWKEVAALGWPGLLVPAALGGSEAPLGDVITLIEEMGRACFPGPFMASAVVATSALLAAASPAQQEQFLPAMALGERIATLAIVEEGATFEPESIALRGEVGRTLVGRKLFVKDAHLADHVIVVTRGGGGFNLFWLPVDRRGVSCQALDAISGEKLFEVTFDGVELREADLLGVPGRGWEHVTPTLRVGALARTGEMVGAAQRVLELAVDYAKVRVQSGRPIGSFQAIQHHCADLLRNVETARVLLHHATGKTDDGDDDAGTAVAAAKAYAGEACLAVARTAHQIFGAIGYCEEHPLHLFHKRIHAASIDFGDRIGHLEKVARSIGLA
jgi:alkylation response protein AidB-like acyl-CoA dehydrogenase